MSDVRTEAAPSVREDCGKHYGSFIWYELITSDPAAAKQFYDAVVGWNIDSEPMSADMDYRAIGRSDGGSAGGVLKLSEDMAKHGARPVWLLNVVRRRWTTRSRLLAEQRPLVLDDHQGVTAFRRLLAAFAAAGNQSALGLAYTFAEVFR